MRVRVVVHDAWVVVTSEQKITVSLLQRHQQQITSIFCGAVTFASLLSDMTLVECFC